MASEALSLCHSVRVGDYRKKCKEGNERGMSYRGVSPKFRIGEDGEGLG